MSIVEYAFFQNAIIGSLLASIACGFIGTYIVSRRLVFISGGSTHASFGGIGIGGGTLSGLSRLLLNTDDVKQIASLALQGHISHINLLIRDISAKPLPGLPMDATASLFANAQGNASREDIAIGLIYMVLQAVGSASILSAVGSGIRDFVLIGNLTLLPQCKYVFPMMEKVYDVHFIIPKYSEFCTAIGAALSFIDNK